MVNERRPGRSTTLGDIGEGGWLKRLERLVGTGHSSTIVGFGDDTACLRVGSDAGPLLLLTTDLLVEGTHFTWKTTTPASLGEKAVAVNASDIAAMGGRPTAMVAGVGARPEMPVRRLASIGRGMRSACRRWNIDFVGGDTVRSDRLTLAVTLAGEFDGPPERLPLRSRMREGQRLYVTGTLGDSAAGLAVLTDENPTGGRLPGSEKMPAWWMGLAERHRGPTPRLAEGQALAQALADLAMIDLSDDLCKSVDLLAEASGTGATVRLHRVPISSGLRRFGRATGRDPLEFAVGGGEDFELLFATGADLPAVRRILESAGLATPVTEIGRAGGKGVRWVDAGGRNVKPNWKPFEHFGKDTNIASQT